MRTLAKLVLGLILLSGCTYQALQDQEDDMTMPGIKWQRSAARKLTTQVSNLTPLLQSPLPSDSFYTAQFSVVPGQLLTGIGGIAPYQAIATLNFTQDGVQNQRKVSIFNGQTISGAGKAIDIKIQDFTPATFPGPGILYDVGVIVSVGPRANFGIPPTLIATGTTNAVPPVTATGEVNLPVGGAITYPVPADAGVSSVEVVQGAILATNPNGLMLVQHLSAAGAVLKSYLPSSVGGSDFEPLAPGTAAVLVANIDGAKHTVSTLTWGIDG
jgi:hypothetical protein